MFSEALYGFCIIVGYVIQSNTNFYLFQTQETGAVFSETLLGFCTV